MKCPIRYNVWVDKENKPVLLDTECLQAECAWWDGIGKSCVVQTAGYFLGTLCDMQAKGGKRDQGHV